MQTIITRAISNHALRSYSYLIDIRNEANALSSSSSV